MIITTDENLIRRHNKNQIMGYIILTIGVVLQLLAFVLAIRTYLNPWTIEGFSNLVQTEGIPLSRMVKAISFFVALALLIAMGVIGGLISKYGMELSRHRSPDGVGDE